MIEAIVFLILLCVVGGGLGYLIVLTLEGMMPSEYALLLGFILVVCVIAPLSVALLAVTGVIL